MTASTARQTLSSLGILCLGSVVAGVFLGGNTDRLEELPGLLLMVPAAIALRGNIFGAMGARLGTCIHAGTFRFSFRLSSVMGENVLSAMTLNLTMSLVLALLGKAFAVAFGVADSIGVEEFIVISVAGGFFASIVTLGVALMLATLSVRYRWDPDNVTVPLVTSAGDVITLPALFVAVWFFKVESTGVVLAPIFSLLIVLWVVLAWHLGGKPLRRIFLESLPVLAVALTLEMFAGVIVENRLEQLADFPSLLVLLPGHLAVAGSLGGILSSRLSTKLHLGIITASRRPEKPARTDLLITAGLALPVYVSLGVIVQVASWLFGIDSPGIASLVNVAVVGGAFVMAIALAVGYFGTIVSVRAGVDPDTYGIPIITSVLDWIGAFMLILVINLLGVA